MDIRDFEGLTKFKVILPIMYILSWIAMFMGPSLFPVVYQKFTIGALIYTIYKITWVLITMIIITVKANSIFNRVKSEEQSENYQSLRDVTEQINYGFIIPNYKEEIELIGETLELLASHKRAKNHYLIFLAMEAHEPNSEQKAFELIQRYRKYFRTMDFTHHHIREYQQKGKASNVSWCAENLDKIFEKNMIDPNTVMLTILDADSWAPDIYFDILEEKILQEYDQKDLRVYQPNQIFTRNNLDVPIFSRVMDILHSFAHSSNLFSLFDITFPLSNYSLSYNLVKRIGFWDTCPDAIGEDFHTTQKAFWKTSGTIETRPIYAPFNQVNICTGNGYWEDVKARFWQAERHAKGVSDVAYNINMLLNQPFRLKNLYVCFLVFETFALTAIVPWVLISMNYQNRILYQYIQPSPELYSEQSIGYLFTIMSVLGTIAYLLFEYNKRTANTLIYKQENESILRILEYCIGFIVIFFGIAVPSFVIAAFGALFGKQQYVVADKKNTLKKNGV